MVDAGGDADEDVRAVLAAAAGRVPYIDLGDANAPKTTRGALTIFLVLLTLSALLLAVGRPPPGARTVSTPILFVLGLLVPSLTVLVLVREAARFVVVVLLRLHPSQIVLGAGPTFVARPAQGAWLVARAFPVFSATGLRGRSPRLFRVRAFVAAAVAPGLTVALIVAIGRLSIARPSTLDLARTTFVLAAMAFLFVNLVPFGRTIPSDGMVLLRVPFMGRAEVDRIVAATLLEDRFRAGMRTDGSFRATADDLAVVLPHLEGGYRVAAMLTIAEQLLAAEDWARAAPAFRDVLRSLPADYEDMATVLNNLAWCHLCLGVIEPGDISDQASQRALEMKPQSAALQGTRGGVLVALGRFGDGLALLRASIEGNDAPESNALNECFVAVGEQGRGDAAAADRALAAARELDPGCSLLGWAEADVAAQRATQG